MELEVSLQCSKDLATGPYPATCDFTPHKFQPILPKIHASIILPFMSRSSNCCVLNSEVIFSTMSRVAGNAVGSQRASRVMGGGSNLTEEF